MPNNSLLRQKLGEITQGKLKGAALTKAIGELADVGAEGHQEQTKDKGKK